MLDNIESAKVILLTSKSEEYLELYFNNLFIQNKKEKVIFFSMDKLDLYKTNELWFFNKHYYKNECNIKKMCNCVKTITKRDGKQDIILIDRIDLLLENKNNKERINLLNEVFGLRDIINKQIIISCVNNEDIFLLMDKINKHNIFVDLIIDVDCIEENNIASLIIYHPPVNGVKYVDRLKERITIVSSYEKKKKDYFHIGMKGVSNEITYDYFVLLVSKHNVYKTSFLTRAIIGSIININKTLFFSSGESGEIVVSDICKENENVYNSYSNLLLINDHLLSFNQLFNYILDKDKEGNGIDVVIIDAIDHLLINETEDKIKYMYRMLFRLAVTSRIHIIVTISEDKIVNINDDCYTYFDKIINISNYEETNEKITFFRKENDKFVEYLDLVKEL